MNRRQFLRRTLMAALAACCRDPRPALAAARRERILVLGAGIAGLAAARALSRSGHEVLVLEARDRIGGRIWTSRLWKNSPLDLGASWLHGIESNPISALASEFHAGVLDTNYAMQSLYHPDGSLLEASETRDAERTFAQLLQDLRSDRKPRHGDASLMDAIQAWARRHRLDDAQSSTLFYFVRTRIEMLQGAEAENLSLLSWNAIRPESARAALFPAGFDQITDGLSQGLDIRTGCRVRAVEYDANSVTVHTDSERFSADRTVVALPLGVLQSGGLQWAPDLPSRKRTAMERVRMGLVNKCYLRFRRVAWPERSHWLGCIPERRGEWTAFTNLYPILRKPILLGLNSGDFAARLEDLSDEDIVAGALSRLRRIFGVSLPDPEAALITRWKSDPYALGSFAHLGIGASLEDLDALALPASHRVHFAGEHTSRQPATTQGAYRSGLRAAEEITSLV